jgi:hypothetical protein
VWALVCWCLIRDTEDGSGGGGYHMEVREGGQRHGEGGRVARDATLGGDTMKGEGGSWMGEGEGRKDGWGGGWPGETVMSH